ncbi:hypothetical protein P43SY_002020 [Pythium insidiosum]|uniref:Nucleoporin Nup120/160 beta-propeller domain-containing protein n=1 Tax=Pythium insidiosum TaxID=114742 RepID=A0AAD5LF46_PYTIN|nr:hypothetical protein P43SY_002020 [Pythium insidiosum]
MTAAFTASAALQEAPFACFEDEDFSLGQGTSAAAAGPSRRELPTFNVTLPPPARALPPRTVTKLRSLETVGSGTFYFQNDALRHRFLCWRVNKNVVLLREFSLHESLEGNGLRLQFPAVVVPTGVTALEAWDGQSVVVAVVTHAGSIHRFSFPIPSQSSTPARDRPSVLAAGAEERNGGLAFPPASSSSIFPRKPHYKLQTDIVNTLQVDEGVTTALWVNEYNVVVATDAGRMVGVNFGLPTSGEPVTQEFLFSDESVVKWLWNGLVKGGSGRRSSGTTNATNSADSSHLSSDAIVAMTFFPLNSTMDSATEIDGEVDDVCLLTLAADFTLRAWSFRTQVCLGKQNIRALLVNSIDVQMKKNESEDQELPFQLSADGVETLIDNFYVERLLLPGRFSRQCLYNAVSEYHGTMIPTEITHEGEKGFRHRTSSAASSVLPWLPYNVFDAVLNASEFALTRGYGSPHVEASDIALRTAAQKLRERLAEYFRYAETLEQARRVAGLASTL